MNVDERIAQASLEDLKRGYTYDAKREAYTCLRCGAAFEEGQVYMAEGRMYEAKRYVRVHAESAHGSMLDYLLSLDKKATGLTDLQRELLEQFAGGLSDAEIVKRNGSGSASTIRNHRFALKERAKQAKLFLAVMELTETAAAEGTRAVRSGSKTEMIDARHVLSEEEYASLIRQYFPGEDDQLAGIPRKEKRKLAILRHLITWFEAGRMYREPEVNDVLRRASAEEYVTLRRYLIEYGFLDRKDDGSAYWVKEGGSRGHVSIAAAGVNEESDRTIKEGGSAMNSKEARKQLVQEYQDKKREMGVYRIYHRESGRTWVGSSMTLDKALSRDQFILEMGSHTSKALQADWTKEGKEAFEMEILEELKLDDTVRNDYKDVITPEGEKRDVVKSYKKRLEGLERHWIEKLGSEEPNGYNKKLKV